MIVRDKLTLKNLIETLNTYLVECGISVKRARLYEILSHSQGFNTKAAMVAQFPLLLDISSKASASLLSSIQRYGILAPGSTAPNSNILERVEFQVRQFPVFAPQEGNVEITIDWEAGHVSSPYPVQPWNRGSTWRETFGRELSVRLASVVFEEEFERLKGEITPYVECVKSEFIRPLSEEESVVFTSDAQKNIDTIISIVEGFCFQCTGDIAETAISFYGDDEIQGPMWGEESTEVQVSGQLLLDHSYSDLDLRHIVACDVESAHIPLDPYYLYDVLREWRDLCRQAYKNPI